MKIVLLSPPYLPEYMRNARCDFVSLSATQWYPILLGYCGAYLEGKGHDVKLIDAPANYLTHEDTRKIVRDFSPGLIALYTGFKSEDNDINFTDSLVHELGCDAVIVGPFASIDPRSTLANSRRINKLVTGEFERPVDEIASGLDIKNIGNLLYKDGDRIARNPERPYLNNEELDAIPFVSRFFKEHVDIYRYKTPSESYPFMDIMTGRGCKWGMCTYCLWVHTYIKGPTYNMRSIPNVIDEFRYIAKEIPEIKSVMIQDDTFVEARAREFSEAKIASGNRLRWSCYARGDIGYETLKLMNRSGCRNLHVGYESASPEVLKTIKKGLSVDKMTEFTRNAKKAGLRIHGDFAIGFPGETVKDAEETIEWAYRLNPDTAQFQIMIPFPGTPFYDYMVKRGWLNKDGQPNMPDFTNDQIRVAAKRGYRKFYISPKYAWKCARHPYDHFFSRIKTIARAIPAIFWKRWDV